MTEQFAPSPLAPKAPPQPPPSTLTTVVEPDETKKKKKKGGKFGSKRGIETLFRTQYPMHVDLSALADSKSNIMISINGIIVSLLIASIAPGIDANPWLILPTISLLLGCLVSLVYAIFAAMPRVNRNAISLDDVRANRANILFFGNFVYLNKSDYIKGMSEMLQDKNDLYTSMMTDIYALGGVLDRKFRLLRVSYIAFTIGLVVGISLFIWAFLGINNPEINPILP